MDGGPSAPGQSRECTPIPPTQDPWAHAPGLPYAESSSQLYKGCNSLRAHTSLVEGAREGSGAGWSGQSPHGYQGRVFRGEAAPGKEEAGARGGGGGHRGEQRVTLAVVNATGAPGRLKEGCGDVEKAGQG